MQDHPIHQVFRFGVFEAHEGSGELRKHGVRIKLHSQPFKVLLMLLENRSVVVTREEMRQRLWGQETFVDFDHGLNTAVNKIREALGDSASMPRFVETVPGKGYRFVAPVVVQSPFESPSEKIAASSEGTGTYAGPGPAVHFGGPAGPVQVKGSLGNVGYAAPGFSTDAILTTADELPVMSPMGVRTLLVLVQAMYLGFYLGALANLGEIHDIFLEAGLPHAVALLSLLITTAAALIPIRLFIIVAVALNFPNLPSKFSKLFPLLLILDLLWAVAPFLLIHHINTGLALGLSAPLVYAPLAQRSLVLIYSRGRYAGPKVNQNA